MGRASFRFYAQLNDFLSPAKRQSGVIYDFELPVSIKHVIEAIGVPHTEIGYIVVNGEPVDFTYLLQDGDRVSVYPAFENLDITQPRLRTPDDARFVLDVHLGRLAAYLRMLGFDTLYPDDYRDEELARLSSTQGCIWLTKDRGLLKRNVVTRGYYVRETRPECQLAEVVRVFNLASSVRPFYRCLSCNGLLKPVEKDAIADRLLANTKEYYDEFRICRDCGKIYWKGSHYQRMQRLIERVLNNTI